MSNDLPEAATFKPGGSYRTRDRREVRIERISQQEGLICGEVQMHGPCAWRLDGRYRDAPFGAPGPLDLVPPTEKPAAAPKAASLKEALEGDNRLFCCD
jgi:hypothetical protein